jgi:opacity protein-like surface antigen
MKKDYLNPMIMRGAGFAGAVCLIACAATPMAASAQPPPYQGAYSTPGYQNDYVAGDIGFCFSANLGLSLMPDFDSSRYGVPGHFSPDAGVRFTVAPGFNFIRSDPFDFGAEFETGVIYNHLRSVTLAGNPMNYHGDFYQVPLLVNLVFKAHPTRDLTPYVGVGGGGDVSSTHLRDFDNGDDFHHHDRYKTDADPAVQAMIGVRYRVWRYMEVGAEYKYLADFSSSTIETHSILATFTMEF